MKVSVIAGSKSDMDIVENTLKILNEFEIKYSFDISSAHRNPENTINLVKKYDMEGVFVFIGIAGMSAHLPGFIASYTIKPVIGVPIASSSLGGIDALLSISQMPSGVPVLTMSLGKAGAVNAALTAISILALSDKSLQERLEKYRHDN